MEALGHPPLRWDLICVFESSDRIIPNSYRVVSDHFTFWSHRSCDVDSEIKISRRHIELIASATRILELSLSQDVYIHDVEEEKDEVDFVDETKISSQTLQSAPPEWILKKKKK